MRDTGDAARPPLVAVTGRLFSRLVEARTQQTLCNHHPVLGRDAGRVFAGGLYSGVVIANLPFTATAIALAAPCARSRGTGVQPMASLWRFVAVV